MTAREDAIEAAWKAIPDDPEVEHMDIAAAVVDAAEPIIRADERERAVTHSTGTDTGGPCCECCYEVGGRNFHLRAQVEALEIRQPWGPAGTAVISRREVLALLGGESDE